jgi:hypothetical protein
MMKAYLQNKQASYYYIGDTGQVALTDLKTSLQTVPEVMESVEELNFDYRKYKDFPQNGFIFRNDALRILSHIFFKMGAEASCVFTMEADENICGDLDFSSARIYGGKEMRICCIHF